MTDIKRAVDKVVKDIPGSSQGWKETLLRPLGPLNTLSRETGGSGNIFTDAGRGIGYDPSWTGAFTPTPEAPTPTMPGMDADAIARARRMAALKAGGQGRSGTFLGGSKLG